MNNVICKVMSHKYAEKKLTTSHSFIFDEQYHHYRDDFTKCTIMPGENINWRKVRKDELHAMEEGLHLDQATSQPLNTTTTTSFQTN